MSFKTNELVEMKVVKVRMQKRARVLGLLCIATCMIMLAGCQQSLPSPDTWQEYKLGGGIYGVKFPSKPKEVTQSTPSVVGTLKVELHQLEVSRNFALVSSCTQMPPVEAYDVDKGLSAATQGAATNAKSKVKSSTDISKNGVKGKDVYFEGPDNAVMRAKFYISTKGSTPAIFSAIIVSNKKSRLEDEAANAFFDSMNF